VLVGLALVISSCGVPIDDSPVVLPLSPSQIGVTPTPSSSTVVEQPNATVYLVGGEGLVGVRRHLPVPVRVEAVIEAVAAGPVPAEQGRGLRTALLAPLPVDGVVVDRGGDVTVHLSRDLGETGAAEQVLAFAQVVFSITALPGIHSVRFAVGTQPLSVPRGDGSITSEPLTQDDYKELPAR